MKFEIKTMNEWLIVVLIVIVSGFAVSFLWGNGAQFNPGYFFNPNPGVIIMGLETVAAIDIFSGSVPEEISMNLETVSILISMVLLLMIGPWLLYTGYKQDEKNDESALKPWYWFLGGSLSVFSLSSIPVLIISFTVFQNTQTSAEVSRSQDQIRQELQKVGFAAAEYGILNDGFDESFNLSDLDINGLEFEYITEGAVSDSSIIIVAPDLNGEGIGNKIEVMPFSAKVMSYRN